VPLLMLVVLVMLLLKGEACHYAMQGCLIKTTILMLVRVGLGRF
jgi:hypothetical protein